MPTSRCFIKPQTLLLLLALAAGGLRAGAAAQAVPQAARATPAPAKTDELQLELDRRIEAVNAAQAAGNPVAIAQANQRLLAVALRMMARLRLLEHAYPQAIVLYRQSLALEDAPEAHLGLAESAVHGGQDDLALEEASKLYAGNPEHEQAAQILVQAYMDKQQYAQAAELLNRIVARRPSIAAEYSLAIAWLGAGTPAGKAKAQQVFAQMEKQAGDSGSLHVLFGRAYRDAGMMPEAVKQFERAVALDPATPHAHYFLGLAHLAMNEWKPTPEAKAELAKELDYHPRDFLANYMLGFIASNEHQYADATKYLTAASEIDPTWPEPFLYMGLDAYAQGDAKSAEPLLRRAVELTGSDESRGNYQIRRAYVDLGRILANSGREQEGDAFLAKARDLQNRIMRESQQQTTRQLMAAGAGGSSGTMAALVPLDVKQENQAAPIGGPEAPVNASLLAQAKLSPELLDAVKTQEEGLRRILGQSFNGLALAQAMQHDYAAALPSFQEAEKWSPETPDLYKNLGLCAYRLKNYPEAARALVLAVKAAPDKPALRAMLGMSYFAMEKYGDAATAFYPLGEPGMEDKEVGYAWAASLTRAGDLKHASEVLERYQQLPLPDDAKLLVGELWVEIGDYGKAVEELHAALAANPRLRRAHYFAGLADIRWEHWDDARKELEAELAMAPGDPDATYELGFVDLQESKNADAQKRFESVVAGHPDYGNAQYELGKLLLDQGKLVDAVPHLEAAARLLPEKDYVHYQLQAAYRKQARPADADRELALYQELKAKSRPHLDPRADSRVGSRTPDQQPNR